MLALLAMIAFIVALVIHGGVHSYVFWMLLGLALHAADHAFTGLGYEYPRFRRR